MLQDPTAATMIRTARLARGLSQTALARVVGIDRPLLSRLETGFVEPGPAIRRRLAVALGLLPEQIERPR